MKAFEIMATRDVTESVKLIIPANSEEEAMAIIENNGTDILIEKFAEKDGDSDYPNWQLDDPAPDNDPYLPDPNYIYEVWICDRCGEQREPEEVQNHLNVCEQFPPAKEQTVSATK